MSIFQRFHKRLQYAIVNRLNWYALRNIQEQAGIKILNGNNTIIVAPTAEGKTEAAFFPVLSLLLENPSPSLQCIYISPLRALLNNLEARLYLYSQMVGISCFKWHGEAKKSAKTKFIKSPANILLITPESLEVMLLSSKINNKEMFENLHFVIIDEIHNLADCDRGNHLLSVLGRIKVYAQYDFQSIALSATVGNPQEIVNWFSSSSQRENCVVSFSNKKTPKKIIVKYMQEKNLPESLMIRALNQKSFFFCNSRKYAEKIAGYMTDKGIKIFVHHSSISKETRESIEEAMTGENNICIICTSTLELGIDVGDLDKIFQENAPATVSSFLQRMGRTGRRKDSKMNTTFFATNSNSLLQAIAVVELARDKWVENIKLNDRSWHILIHQILALCLQNTGLTQGKMWKILSNIPCFRGINQSEFHEIIKHLLKKEYLLEVSSLLSIGKTTEKQFGYKNFMELYCVFSSHEAFHVKETNGNKIGTIEWKFADLLREDSRFFLGGISWIVKEINYKLHIIWVTKCIGGKLPEWQNDSFYLLSYELCRKIYNITVDNAIYPYCDEPAKEQLEHIRKAKPFLYQKLPLEINGDYVKWWTYAGGRINNVLSHSLSYILKEDVTCNNYCINLKNHNLPDLIKKMNKSIFWKNKDLHRYIISKLQLHRLSKFQHCLPRKYQFELLANELLDIEGSMKYLSNLETH